MSLRPADLNSLSGRSHVQRLGVKPLHLYCRMRIHIQLAQDVPQSTKDSLRILRYVSRA